MTVPKSKAMKKVKATTVQVKVKVLKVMLIVLRVGRSHNITDVSSESGYIQIEEVVKRMLIVLKALMPVETATTNLLISNA